MLTLRQSAGRWLLGTLAAAIMITRVDHFGTAFTPPDVTLASLFLVALWLRSGWGFFALLAAAGLADWIALWQGVSDWCLSPAYPFLIPTYACMWLAGHACRGIHWLRPREFALGAGIFVLGNAVAFVISNGSFYFLADYFTRMSLLDYWRATIRYYPYYLQWAALYAGAALAIAQVARAAQQRAIHAAERVH